MKQCSTLFLLLFILANTAYSQSGFSPKAEFGIDITTPIIWASGGNREHNELEFIYRETQDEKDLRFKLLVSNYNFYGNDVIANTLIEENLPDRLLYHRTRYLPKNSYVGSIGLAKYLKANQLPVYVGADFNLGVSRGTVLTEQQTLLLTEENSQTLSQRDNNFVVLGITPIIGVKKNLTERIVFGIEFGASLNTIFGEIQYDDAQGERQALKVRRFDPLLDRIINDIVLMIRI